MTTFEEVSQILSRESERDRQILAFAALLTRETKSEVIVVGGSAIEIYTKGGYASGDIDIVGNREAIHRVLSGWHFEDKGMLWIQKVWKLAVDVRGDVYSGSRYRLSTIQTPFGPVLVAGIEDLIVKRLAEVKHWHVKAALEEAALLWTTNRDRVDELYLEEQATSYDVLDVLSDLRKTVGRLESS